MKRQFLHATLALAALFCCIACENDDTDFSALINKVVPTPDDTLPGDDGDADDPETTPAVKEIALDDSELDEGTEQIPASASDEAYNDYVENADFAYTVAVSYDGTTATLSGDVSRVSVHVSGAQVTVTSAAKGVHYILTGTSSNGFFKVYSEHKFKLTLNALTLTNPHGAAINNQGGKSAYVVLADGTVSTLTDGDTYTQTPASEDEKAAFFSEGQLIFSGSGSLRVRGNCKHGIASDDYIRFRPGSHVSVSTTVGHGIKANDGVFIGGGVINVEVSGNAAKGINSSARIEVSGGRTTVITSGNPVIAAADTSSCAAIKCDSAYVQSGGTVNLKSTGSGGKGLNCHERVVFTGGELNIVALGTKGDAAPKALKCDAAFLLTGGSLYAYSAESKPLDAAGTVTIADGFVTRYHDDRFFIVDY